MKKLMFLSVMVFLLILTSCQNQINIEPVEYDYTNDTFTLDEYYNNMTKYAYYVGENEDYFFEDLESEPIKINLNRVVKSNEKIKEVKADIYPFSEEDFKLYQISNNMNNNQLNFTTTGLITFIAYENVNKTNGVVVCNLFEKDCERKEIPENNVHISTFKALNNNNMFVMVQEGQSQYQVFFIDDNLNFIEVFNDDNGMHYDFDYYNGNYLLLEHKISLNKEELILIDVSDYKQGGVKKVSKEFPRGEVNSLYQADYINGLIYKLTENQIKVYNFEMTEQYYLTLPGENFIGFLNDQYLLVSDDVRYNENFEPVGSIYLFDYQNKIPKTQIEFSGGQMNRLLNYRNSKDNFDIPIVLGNKLYFLKDLFNSHYIDLESKTITETDLPPVGNGGKYFTEQALLFKKACDSSVFEKMSPEITKCNTNLDITIIHETEGIISELPYITTYFVDEEMYFYQSENKLFVYQYENSSSSEVFAVNQTVDIMKYNQYTYVMNIDGTYYSYQENTLAKLEQVNSIIE